MVLAIEEGLMESGQGNCFPSLPLVVIIGRGTQSGTQVMEPGQGLTAFPLTFVICGQGTLSGTQVMCGS